MSTKTKLETSTTWTRSCSNLWKLFSLSSVRAWRQGVVNLQPLAWDWVAYTVRYFRNRITSRWARYSNHLTTLRHDRYENSTELSKHVWSMKRDNRQYVIDWKIRDTATSFDNTSKRCGLCTTEKYHILETDARTRLNKRNEIVSKCRHESKYVLSNFVPIT